MEIQWFEKYLTHNIIQVILNWRKSPVMSLTRKELFNILAFVSPVHFGYASSIG